MAKNWTKTQLKAIETTDRTLLISAGAGSGKTTVLIERILRSILREDPVGVDEMLVVTYTRAAAQELRDRLGEEIKNALKNNPENEFLQRQLYLLPGARICTIDSYCADLVKRNAERVGVSPVFRVPDEAEVELLAENLLDGMFADMYEGRLTEVATPEQISDLCDALTDNGRQKDLSVILRHIYSSTKNADLGVEMITPLVEEYNPERFTSVEDTRLGGYVLRQLREFCTHYQRVFSSVNAELESKEKKKVAKIQNMILADLEFVNSVLLAIDSGYDATRALVYGYKVPNSVSNTDETLPPTTVLRSNYKDRFNYLANKFFFATSEHWKRVYADIYPLLSTLLRVLKKFDELYRREKARLSVCEYSDLERYAYECLYDGEKLSDVAIAEREGLSRVFIDEYQDVNLLQDKIFRAITPDGCGFMVGDIKQSIYRFRSAAADIFANMKRTYPEIDSAKSGENAAIYMSQNFRCDRGVIDYVNEIFDRVFYHLRDSIGYITEDRLICSKYDSSPESEPPYKKPEMCLINMTALNAHYKEMGWGRVKNEEAEALLVAQKINEMIESGKEGGEVYSPGDFAIIMRKAKNRAEVYKKALDAYGIPSALVEQTAFFNEPVVMLAICLLNVVDNPSKDIYLTGVMLSPLYEFTPDELSFIKAEGGDTLYTSLIRYVKKNPDFTKGVEFVKSIAKYRLLAEGTAADRLLMRLYHETGLLSLGAREGTKEHLLRLYECARTYEHSSFKGLFNFINYLNSISSRNNSLDKREAPKGENEVKIVTVHASKGLQYRVVFFVGIEDSISATSYGSSQRFRYAENFGIGMLTRTEGGLALVKNSTREIIDDYTKRCELEELSRIVYVALTRAKESLYLVGAKANLEKELKSLEVEREYLSDYSIYEQVSPLYMLLCSRVWRVYSPSEFLNTLPPALAYEGEEEIEKTVEKSEKIDTGVTAVDEIDLDMVELCKERFTFEYPFSHLTVMPEKTAVSVLSPRMLDELEEGDSGVLSGGFSMPPLGVLPEFMGGTESDASAKRGIATHWFMQFFDIEKLKTNGLESELERLLQMGYITATDIERIRMEELERFICSDLFLLMQGNVKLYREMRFNVNLPCELFANEEEYKEKYRGREILVQGVIDCIIEDEDGTLHLIDYKTDRLSESQIRDIEKARDKLTKAHRTQLRFYSEAILRIFGVRPSTVQVYSTVLGRLVDIDINDTDL